MVLQRTMPRMPGASRTARSSATRATFSGTGVNTVSSWKIASDGSPMAGSATVLLPLVWSRGLPKPLSAAISASAAPRWSLSAALTTPSARRASSPRSAASSSDPITGSMPWPRIRAALSASRTSPRTLWPPAISRAATAPPMKPFAPVRKMRIATSLDIQVGDAQRVGLDEVAPRLDEVAHQLGEDQVGVRAFLDLDLEQRAHIGVERRFPELLRVHLAQ